MNCVVEPFIISVKNTIPPVKKTNCTKKKTCQSVTDNVSIEKCIVIVTLQNHRTEP